jgi:glutathione S-transferase
MHVLHTETGSGGFAVQAVLEAAGAEYRLVEVEGKSAGERTLEFLKLSPLGQVPVLELPDGAVMTESAAILIHLADTLAPGRLAPDAHSPDRPAFLRWVVFMAVNLYGADLRLYYPERYTTDESGAQAVKQAALAHMDAQFAILEAAIGDNRLPGLEQLQVSSRPSERQRGRAGISTGLSLGSPLVADPGSDLRSVRDDTDGVGACVIRRPECGTVEDEGSCGRLGGLHFSKTSGDQAPAPVF